MTFRLHPVALDDLTWLLSGEAQGDCGVRSTAAGQLAAIELGALVQRTAKSDFTLDEDSLAFRSIGRLREVTAVWGATPRRFRDVLEAAYGPHGPKRPLGLDGFLSVDGGDDLGGVVFLTQLAREEHARSRSTRDFLDWLQRLSKRLTSPAGKGKQEQRRKDEDLRCRLIAQAQQDHDEAARAFEGTWSRFQVAKRQIRRRRREEAHHAA